MPEDNPKEKIKKIKRWLPLILLATLMVVAFSSGILEQLNLEALQTHKEALLSKVTAHPVISALAFIGSYITVVALSLPVALIFPLTGGFLFGKWLGTLYVVGAATLGASLIFLIAKTALGETLRGKAGGLYKRIESNMKENAIGYLLFMRLVPVFPFFLVNIVPALFNIPLRAFILTSFFGMIPGSFVFVNLGEQLGEINNLSDLISGETLLAFALLGFLALVPTLYKQLKARKKTATAILAAMLILSTNTVQASPYDNFISLYGALLTSHVRVAEKNGIEYSGVDYQAWKSDPLYPKALNLLKQSDLDLFETRNEKIAFWVNAYNFLTIDLIARENESESIKNLGSIFQSPWKKYKWKINGENYTLDQIEHKILRPMGEARIHFAINCASVSCPDLREQPYSAKNLNKQLNEQTMITLSNPGKGFVENENEIRINKFFDWFAKDFNNGDVKTWLQPYMSFNQEKPLRYLDYDWSLNNIESKAK